MADLIDDLCRRVETAAREGTRLRPAGGGTKDFYGGPLQGEPVSMAEWTGIQSYEPTELVMTVKAGTPLAEVEAALDEKGQMLAFEPPRLGASSTIGGVVAAGLSGPARLSKGPVKDYILGCGLIDGRGQHLHFGGTVMKNVAGYDISRVLPGSLGSLGLIEELSIKVMPKAIEEATLVFDLNLNQAIRQINTWLSQPLPINASVSIDGNLTVRLRGASAAVSSAIKTMGGRVLDPQQADALWNSLRDQTHPFFKTEGNLWRLSVPPLVTDLALAGELLVEWGGGQRWYKPGPGVTLEMIRGVTERAGGHATLYRSSDAELKQHTFHTPAAPMLKLQRKLQQQFDPAGIFSTGRLAPIL